MEERSTDREERSRQWKSSTCIIGSSTIKGVAVTGAVADLTVYLIRQYHVGRIAAAEVNGVINGCTSISPIFFGALADTSVGCFAVSAVTTAASLLSFILLTLTSSLPSLRPPPCSPDVTACPSATVGQLLLFFFSVALLASGIGGTRYNMAALGADQLDGDRRRATFFNWYIVGTYISSVSGQIGIVYLLENSGYSWGFGVCAALTSLSLFIFLHGGVCRYYRVRRPLSSNPFASLFRDTFGYLGRPKAAEDRPLIDGADVRSEDLKTAARLLPLISSSLLLSATISTQASLTILQAMVMNRHVSGFDIPAATVTVFTSVAAAASIAVLDVAVFPMWRAHTPLHRIAVGHVINAVAMLGSAVVESRRLAQPEISVTWLAPPLLMVGLGEAFHFPGQIELSYQEFPTSLRCTATGMAALTAGLGFYVSTAFIAAVGRFTGWLRDDLNQSRLDIVYWILAAIGFLNFCYFLVCWSFYKRRARL